MGHGKHLNGVFKKGNMATEYVRSEEKHKTLKDAVDSAYLATLQATTQLEDDMDFKAGTFLTDYRDFRYWFKLLFGITKNEPEMAGQHKDLIAKIEHWLHNRSNIKTFKGKNKKIVKEGIKLAREWNSAIRSRDVIKQ